MCGPQWQAPGPTLPGEPGPGRHTGEPNLRSYRTGSPGRSMRAVVPGYDNAGVMSGRALATYPWTVKRMPGIPLAPSSAQGTAHTTVQHAWHGLIQVLIGPDPPPVWRWSSPRERQLGYAALWVVTLALCAANLVGGFAEPGQLLLAVPTVAPLPLATRRPMLAWRIGWLALLGAMGMPGIRFTIQG